MRWQECPVPVACLAAGRDGRSDTRLGAGALGHDGRGGRVSGGTILSGVHAGGAAGDRGDRRDHAVHGGHDRDHGHGYQAGAGLFDGQPTGLHDAGPWGGRVAGRHDALDHACVLQEPAVPVFRIGDSRRAHERDADMGGLRKKMPITAYTMLVGCLAIAGIGIPFVIGFSGYYSKDMILEQAFSFWNDESAVLGRVLFHAAAGGAAITAFYMFRLWYMTFAGEPRDQQRYEHAHESPKSDDDPADHLGHLCHRVAWSSPFSSVSLKGLLEQARPLGTAATVRANWSNCLAGRASCPPA